VIAAIFVAAELPTMWSANLHSTFFHLAHRSLTCVDVTCTLHTVGGSSHVAILPTSTVLKWSYGKAQASLEPFRHRLEDVDDYLSTRPLKPQ
jgi:hypothetical protein